VTFAAALCAVVIWLVSGPFMHWNEAWNFLANTTTTIITFLIIFLIQNTQNRDSESLHLKLDELISVTAHARDRLVGLEDRTEEELEHVKAGFDRVAKKDD
jgi:low affinity Fe/Cu permease